ncbi:MAG: general secretion pathway protein GspB [Gammaproteobacteria bacterium]|nr:general secretion pathway protein GspB [Gammaproteobacteria bacterium]
MSYILDALQKSTAEGNPTLAASLMRRDTRYRRHQLVGGLIVVALVANVIVFAWLFWPEQAISLQTPQLDQPTPEVAASAPSTVGAPINADAPTRVAKPAAEQGEAEPTPTPEPPPTAAIARSPIQAPPKSEKTVTLEDLPITARLAFPDIEFSTHIYAQDKTLRAIVANGRRLTEGDRIQGLELIEITREGVIFRYRQYLIAVSVLALWEDA